jgi:hypothetical protein
VGLQIISGTFRKNTCYMYIPDGESCLPEAASFATPLEIH